MEPTETKLTCKCVILILSLTLNSIFESTVVPQMLVFSTMIKTQGFGVRNVEVACPECVYWNTGGGVGGVC